MKIVTIVGARPQFIKAAVVSHEIRKKHEEVLIHTGQHYDYNMSGKFFEELDIPEANFNLGISGGSHAEMTGRMMMSIEKILIDESPDWVLLYGDTNSTLAAALAAAKLHLKICHVEAGARTNCRTNPEEINRICTDHVSTLLLASTQSGINSLKEEGLSDKCLLVGDPMYDAFLKYNNKIRDGFELKLLNGETRKVPNNYYYLTCHREENTKDDYNLYEIFKAMNQLEHVTVYPVHPRNKERATNLVRKYDFDKIILTEPVGYLESIYLVNHSKKIVTDSGGLQREAFFANKQCVTVLDFICWPETMIERRNQLSVANSEMILQKLKSEQDIDMNYRPFGDGKAAIRIVEAMERYGAS